MTEQQEEQEEDKEIYSYCLPSPLAKFMSKIDDRTQMEASLMSMFLLLIGLITFATYMVVFTDLGWWFKVMTAFNTLCGFIFLFSYLVTTFQQYQALRETQEFIGTFGTEEPFPQQINNKSNLKEVERRLEK